MTMTTAKQWYAAAHGNKVERRVTGASTIETWEHDKAKAKTEAAAKGFILAEETPDSLTFHNANNSGQKATLHKAKEVGLSIGVITVRSSDYFFVADNDPTPKYGDKAGAKVSGLAMIKTYPNGRTITFTIQTDALANAA